MFALIYPAAIKQRLIGLPESTLLLVKSPFLLVDLVEFSSPTSDSEVSIIFARDMRQNDLANKMDGCTYQTSK